MSVNEQWGFRRGDRHETLFEPRECYASCTPSVSCTDTDHEQRASEQARGNNIERCGRPSTTRSKRDELCCIWRTPGKPLPH
eukprot:4086963-Pyramimonas_sp.AAC.1